MPEGLKEMFSDKEKWVILWNAILVAVFIPNDIVYLSFYNQYNFWPKFILVSFTPLSWLMGASLIYYVKFRTDENRWMIWIPICLG